MRYLALFLFIASTTNAAEITCYDGQRTLYHGFGHHVQPIDGELIFTEDHTNNVIMMLNPDCIVKWGAEDAVKKVKK